MQHVRGDSAVDPITREQQVVNRITQLPRVAQPTLESINPAIIPTVPES